MTPSGLLAIGETMALVTPSSCESLADAQSFRVHAGGAESNVAAHVAALGHRARWFSRLGADALGRRVSAQLKARGIDVSTVVFDAHSPTGLYVKDPGKGVIYFRADSAASQLSPEDVDRLDWDGVRVLHASGITSAISASAGAFLTAAISRAVARGITVSFDVNHRAALWDAPTAAPVLADLVGRAHVVFVGRDEAETLWSTTTAKTVRALFPSVPELVVKDGEIGATSFAGDIETFAPSRSVEVVEAVGAGDAFAGGYLAGMLAGLPVVERLHLGHERAAQTLRTTDDFPEKEAHK
ncbi:sugar kinase [Agreia sp.]|uniref:sugar kinase n=1 Tax=Agreia sp. TaxID=1872416 RepID=UPI0035BC4308